MKTILRLASSISKEQVVTGGGKRQAHLARGNERFFLICAIRGGFFILIAWQGACAGDPAELDQILSGFDAAPPPAVQTPPPQDHLPAWLNGAVTLSASGNFAHDAPPPGQTDYRGLSRLRAKLALELKHRFGNGPRVFANGYGYYDAAYALNGRDGYPPAVLDEYESDTELGELYVQGKADAGLDFKLGRQIVIWGKSDNLRVTDVLNPLDRRELGLVDIEDLRLPVTMAKLDFYQGDWNFSAMWIPEVRVNKNPPYGSDFYPFPVPQPAADNPDHGGSHSEFAAAANGIFSGWDLSFYLARLYDNAAAPVDGTLRYSRQTLLGTALNLARGNWLFKAEAAHVRAPARHGDILMGVEYAGFDNTTLSAEMANRHLHGAVPVAGERDTLQLALRYQSDLLYDRLHLTALAVRQDWRSGFTRLSAAYDLVDALTLSGGVVLYHPGDAVPFNAIGDNDRLFVELKYTF